VWGHYENDPWTRDGSVEADVVQVSADVSGLVSQIRVHDNQFVHAGDVLFTIDEDRYEAQFEQAEAAVATAKANIANARAGIVSAQAALANARREQARYLSLGDLVSREVQDQRTTTVEQDRAALAQAEATLAQARAGLDQAVANRKLAHVNLDRSSVRAGSMASSPVSACVRAIS
jgi:multidrug resistance efflux pump